MRHDDAGVMLLLSSSLPTRLSGYAVRSHAIAGHLLRHGVRLKVFTSPGFPLSTWTGPLPVAPRDSVDDVTYNRLPLYPAGMGDNGEAYRAQAANLLAAVIKRSRVSIVHAASNMDNGLPALLAQCRTGGTGVWRRSRRG